MSHMKNIGYLKLAVGNGHYAYDTTTNALIELEESVHRLLDDYFKHGLAELRERYLQQMSPEDLSSAVDFIDHAVHECGMFQPYFRKDYSTVLDPDYLQELLSTRLSKLVLSVTEHCNQRCTYCQNSQSHAGNRGHRDGHMTWNVAKQSIDYFLARRDKDKEVSISFYGGEPILKWDLVCQSVHYIHENNHQNNMNIHLVSNATLFTDAIIDFLIDNDIYLQISLDGPRSMHDAARVLPGGRGTHTKVVAALKKIRKRNSDYFKKHVSVNCTFDPKNDIREIFSYFSAEFSDIFVMINAVKTRDSCHYHISEENVELHQSRLQNLIEAYLDSLRNNNHFNYRLFHSLFSDIFGSLSAREIGPTSTEHRPNGACVVGAARLFVTPEGLFYPCERFRPPGYAIGNCDTGIDVEKVRQLIGTFVGFCDEMCQECWAYRLCKHCFVHILAEGRMSKARKLESCKLEKARIRRAFERFIYIWKKEAQSSHDQRYSLHFQVKSHQAKC